jgi:hypothetical protein
MATATLSDVRVTLDLSLDEAKFLYDLLGQCVVGRGARRDLSSAIFYALDKHDIIINPDFCFDLVGVVRVGEVE